jgi:hypothetical protein
MIRREQTIRMIPEIRPYVSGKVAPAKPTISWKYGIIA